MSFSCEKRARLEEGAPKTNNELHMYYHAQQIKVDLLFANKVTYGKATAVSCCIFVIYLFWEVMSASQPVKPGQEREHLRESWSRGCSWEAADPRAVMSLVKQAAASGARERYVLSNSRGGSREGSYIWNPSLHWVLCILLWDYKELGQYVTPRHYYYSRTNKSHH